MAMSEKRVLAIEVGQIDALLRFGRQLAHLTLAELDVHQQPDDLRIAPEAAAVRMVGRQVDPPRIVDEQQQLEPDRPLDGVDEVVIAVDVRHDPAAGLVLDVQVAPLAPGELGQQVLPRAVGGDRHRIAEQDGADVAGQVLVLDEFLGDLGRARISSSPSRGRRRHGTAGARGARGAPRSTFIVSIVEVTLPGTPRLFR